MSFGNSIGARLLLTAAVAPGQQLEFEVASVRLSHLPPPTPANPIQFSAGPGTSDPGRFTFKNATLRILLTWAYSMKPDQITGPGWLDSERYEIVATVPAGANKEQVKLMMQHLLAERLKLALHRETKVVPLYELVVGKNGPKLAASKEDSSPAVAAQRPVMFDKNGFPILPGLTGMIQRVTNGHVRITARAQFLSELTRALENQLGRRVIDGTGMTGSTISMWTLPRNTLARCGRAFRQRDPRRVKTTAGRAFSQPCRTSLA